MISDLDLFVVIDLSVFLAFFVIGLLARELARHYALQLLDGRTATNLFVFVSLLIPLFRLSLLFLLMAAGELIAISVTSLESISLVWGIAINIIAATLFLFAQNYNKLVSTAQHTILSATTPDGTRRKKKLNEYANGVFKWRGHHLDTVLSESPRN